MNRRYTPLLLAAVTVPDGGKTFYSSKGQPMYHKQHDSRQEIGRLLEQAKRLTRRDPRHAPIAAALAVLLASKHAGQIGAANVH